ncbi:MAG: diguanylate cyclase domain-containing protein, partial [Burkholderiales bacterium]
MLLIVSPFLVIVVVLVSIAVVSFNILSAGRAFVEGESLWSKNQKQAVFHLILFAKSGNAGDFQRYREAMKVPLGFRKARLELIKPIPNDAIVMESFIEGGTHPDDVTGVLKLFQRFRNVSYMENVLDTWESGDNYIAELDVTAVRLHAMWSAGDPDAFAINVLLNHIVQINETLIPLENQFSNTMREAVRWIQTILYLVILTVAGTLIPIGISLTLRIVRRVDRAEEEVKALRLGQMYAEKLAFQASHDGLTGLVNRPEFESRLVRAIQNAPVAGRQHAVMFLDLDQFKIVNDTCGHAVGDQLLRQVSSLLKKSLRATDTLSR